MSKRYRDYSLSLVMLAGSGLLLATLLWQWRHYSNRESELKRQLAGKAEVHLEATAGEEKTVELPGLEEYPEMVQRPLFMEGRRPVAAEASEPVAAETSPLTVKLMGIVFSPGETMALFIDDKGKYKRLRVNDTVNGWKVAQIKSDKAIMEQNGSSEELKLVKPKMKKNPAAPRPPNVPAGQIPGQQPGTDNPNPPEESIDSGQPPNDAVDESAVPSEDIPNDQ